MISYLQLSVYCCSNKIELLLLCVNFPPDAYKPLSLPYGSIFMSLLLVKVVWDKNRDQTWRMASVTISNCVKRIGVRVVSDSGAVLGR